MSSPTRAAATATATAAKREFDIVIFGATGFTGIRALEHVKRNANTTLKGLRIAIAGRSKEKVAKAADEAQVNLPIITADSGDAKSLDDMCQRTNIVLTFVGPYSLYGMPLADACVRNGTSMIDITGEPPYVRSTVEKHHDEAVAKGVYLLSCSAFDSMPPELCNLLVHRQAKDRGLRIEHVDVAWRMKGGAGFSGGTLASVAAVLPTMTRRDGEPLSMLPAEPANDLMPFTRPAGGYPEQRFVNSSAVFRGWCAPFIMAGVNEKVVRKGNVLMGFNASYKECIVLPSIFAAIMIWLMPFTIVILFIPFVGNFIKKNFLPAPGEGPSREAEKATTFKVFAAGYSTPSAVGQPVIRVRMDSAHSAYPFSAIMPLEVAAALANGELNPEATKKTSSWCGGGVVTPASVVGDAVIRRLAHSNIQFYVTTSQTWETSEMAQCA